MNYLISHFNTELRSWVWRALVGVIGVSLIAWGAMALMRRDVTVSFDPAAVERVVVTSYGYGPRELSAAEHRAFFDDFFAQLQGTYTYERTLRASNTDGGAPARMDLYDAAGELITSLCYRIDRLSVTTRGGEGLYRHKDHAVDFTALDALVREYGKSTR